MRAFFTACIVVAHLVAATGIAHAQDSAVTLKVIDAVHQSAQRPIKLNLWDAAAITPVP